MAVQLNIVGRFDDKELKRAQAALGRLKDDAGRAGGGIRNAFAQTGAKLQGMGSSLTSSLTLPLVGAAAVATKWASDAAESANKVQTVFGKNAVFIDKWSKDSARSFGISQGQAQDYFGSVGTMLQGFGISAQALPNMSNDVLTLAADLGSFHNLDTAEVLDMISASFRGEFDSVQRVIPTINAAAVETEALAQTGKKNAKTLTAQEKAMATYSLLMKGAGPATGDFAKTSDGAANSVKIAQAQLRTAAETIGKTFLPFVAKGAAFVAKLAERFRNLTPGTHQRRAVGGDALKQTVPAAEVVAVLKQLRVHGLPVDEIVDPAFATENRAFEHVNRCWKRNRLCCVVGRALQCRADLHSDKPTVYRRHYLPGATRVAIRADWAHWRAVARVSHPAGDLTGPGKHSRRRALAPIRARVRLTGSATG